METHEEREEKETQRARKKENRKTEKLHHYDLMEAIKLGLIQSFNAYIITTPTAFGALGILTTRKQNENT